MNHLHAIWQWVLIGNNATAVQTIAAVLGLFILCKYAWDTRTLARASTRQLEAQQMPFLSIDIVNRICSVKNFGSGPAINIDLAYAGETDCRVPSLAAGDKGPYLGIFTELVNRDITVNYESLSGTKYETRITWTVEGGLSKHHIWFRSL